MTQSTSFLPSKHIKEIHDTLRCFAEIETVQSVYSLQINEIWYSVCVFCKSICYDNGLMEKLLEKTDEVLELHPDSFFQFSYLQDVNISVAGKDAIVIFERGEENG